MRIKNAHRIFWWNINLKIYFILDNFDRNVLDGIIKNKINDESNLS